MGITEWVIISGREICKRSAGTFNYTLFTSGMWTIYGTLVVFRCLRTGDDFQLWFGLFIGLTHLLIFTVMLFRSVNGEIDLNEVKSIKVKQRFANEFLDIKLRNNRIRRVSQIDNTEGLEQYIDSNFHF